MIPVRFPQANRILLPPAGAEATCDTLNVFADQEQVISRWRPTAEEREKIAAGGDVWICVSTPCGTQPPLAVTADDPFEAQPS